jgi:hypothetical protein
MSAVHELEHAKYAELYKQGPGTATNVDFENFMSRPAGDELAIAKEVAAQNPESLSQSMGGLKYTSNGQLGRVEASWVNDNTNVPGTSDNKASFLHTVRNIGNTELDTTVAVNRYNFLVSLINYHTNLKTDGNSIKNVLPVTNLSFLPRGTLNNGLYGVSAGEYDLDTARTVRLNQISTQPILYPHIGLGLLGGEGQVGGRVITDRLSYCSDNKYLRNHYEGQASALEEAGIKLSQKSKDKVEGLFNNLEKIQVQICKLLRQRELAISGSGEHSQATLDAIEATQDETSFNVVLGDLVKAHRRANQKGLSLIITLEDVIAKQLEAVLDKRGQSGTPAAASVKKIVWKSGTTSPEKTSPEKTPGAPDELPQVGLSSPQKLSAQEVFDELEKTDKNTGAAAREKLIEENNMRMSKELAKIIYGRDVDASEVDDMIAAYIMNKNRDAGD